MAGGRAIMYAVLSLLPEILGVVAGLCFVVYLTCLSVFILRKRRGALDPRLYRPWLKTGWIALAAVTVLGIGALLLEQSELVAWFRAADSDDISTYNHYLSEHPNGMFAEAAKARLTVLCRDAAPLRQKMLNEIASKGQAESIGGHMLSYFVSHPQAPLEIGAVIARDADWPADYADSVLPQREMALDLFANHIGAHVEYGTSHASPFTRMTVVIKYHGEYSSTFSPLSPNSGSMRGIGMTAVVSVYLPQNRAPLIETAIGLQPNSMILVWSSDQHASPSDRDKRKAIFEDVARQMYKKLGCQLRLEETGRISSGRDFGERLCEAQTTGS